MIREVDDFKLIDSFFKRFFPQYKSSSDPFECFYGYFESDKLIGLISVSKIYEREEINYIAVDSDFQKKGIGSSLLDYATNGFEVISLEVACDNESAIEFYLSNGFEVRSVRNGYYGTTDGYLMVKEVR